MQCFVYFKGVAMILRGLLDVVKGDREGAAFLEDVGKVNCFAFVHYQVLRSQ